MIDAPPMLREESWPIRANYSNQFETDRMFVSIICLALFGVALTEVVKVFERKVAPWKETERLQL